MGSPHWRTAGVSGLEPSIVRGEQESSPLRLVNWVLLLSLCPSLVRLEASTLSETLGPLYHTRSQQ